MTQFKSENLGAYTSVVKFSVFNPFQFTGSSFLS